MKCKLPNEIEIEGDVEEICTFFKTLSKKQRRNRTKSIPKGNRKEKRKYDMKKRETLWNKLRQKRLDKAEKVILKSKEPLTQTKLMKKTYSDRKGSHIGGEDLKLIKYLGIKGKGWKRVKKGQRFFFVNNKNKGMV